MNTPTHAAPEQKLNTTQITQLKDHARARVDASSKAIQNNKVFRRPNLNIVLNEGKIFFNKMVVLWVNQIYFEQVTLTIAYKIICQIFCSNRGSAFHYFFSDTSYLLPSIPSIIFKHEHQNTLVSHCVYADIDIEVVVTM